MCHVYCTKVWGQKDFFINELILLFNKMQRRPNCTAPTDGIIHVCQVLSDKCVTPSVSVGICWSSFLPIEHERCLSVLEHLRSDVLYSVGCRCWSVSVGAV